MSEETAKLVSICDKKGTIEVGKQADFVVWDPEAKFIVTEDILLMKNKISPYNGQELFGKVEATYLRGQKIYGSQVGFTSDLPQGIWLKPSYFDHHLQ